MRLLLMTLKTFKTKLAMSHAFWCLAKKKLHLQVKTKPYQGAVHMRLLLMTLNINEEARLVKDKPNAAAIASEVALGLYGLERVAKNIEDKTGNVTRFLVLGKEEVAPSGIPP
jgi:hypothetical protein